MKKLWLLISWTFISSASSCDVLDTFEDEHNSIEKMLSRYESNYGSYNLPYYRCEVCRKNVKFEYLCGIK